MPGALFPAILVCLWGPVSLAAAAAADEPASVPERHQCVTAAEPFLMERIAIWQRRLKLTDWRISFVMSNPGQLLPNTVGEIHWDREEKSAVIRVLSASYYQTSCRDALKDMEFTLVHELIHLELSSLPRSEASRADEEFAVNQITNALLALDRGR